MVIKDMDGLEPDRVQVIHTGTSCSGSVRRCILFGILSGILGDPNVFI